MTASRIAPFSSSLSDLAALDVARHLHPQTNLQSHRHRGALVIARAEGPYVIDEHGRRYLEAMGGLWCASLGFANARLARAAAEQMEKLAYYHTFNHRSSDVTVRLADRLARLVPFEGARIFFANSGSEAVDSMLKMAWNYHVARGEPSRRRILVRDRSYHGSTLLAAGLSGLPHMHAPFGVATEGVVRLTAPYAYRRAEPGESDAGFTLRLVRELEESIVRHGAQTIAAFIAEPIMGAGGVLVPPAGYFEQVQAVLRSHGILMLSDETICGFGRTGEWFGCQSFDFVPDMMSCAKGLSSGHAPISAVAVAPHVYEAIESMSGRTGGFAHGFTYSGHPLSAAVALEALAIYDEMELPALSRRLAAVLARELSSLGTHPMVGEIRGRGFMAGIELVRNRGTREAFEPSFAVGALVEQRTRAHGLVVRNLGDTIALCPPYILSDEEIATMVGTLALAIDEVMGELPADAFAGPRAALA